MKLSFIVFFFFSSRRRHTRFKCDWSSDVCSSDLPAEAEEWYRYWLDARFGWYLRYGLRSSKLRIREHGPEERSHYSQGTSDIEYEYPIGWSELEGVANRGDFDLSKHAEFSGTTLEFVGTEGTERYVPYVIEPAVSIER